MQLSASRSRARTIVATSVVALAVGLAAIATPLRGVAANVIAVFEPRRVAALPLTLAEMRSLSTLPDLSAYASTRELRYSATGNFVDIRPATAAAGFMLRQPTAVPLGVRAVSYSVNGPSEQLLTFENRIVTAGTSAPPPLPADIVGSKLQINLGSTVVATYLTGASAADAQRLEGAMKRLAPPSPNSPTIVRSLSTRSSMRGGSTAFIIQPGGRLSQAPSMHVTSVHDGVRHDFRFSSRMSAMPLVVVQMPVPRVISSGVSVQRLASFMLNRPGVPPRVAAAFRALGDLSTTLPIPVPIDSAYTQPVFVDGVQGVGLGDDTGIGAAVVWQKNGMLYAVFATRTAREVLAIANSLR